MKSQLLVVTIVFVGGIILSIYASMVSNRNITFPKVHISNTDILLNKIFDGIENIVNASDECNFSRNSLKERMEYLKYKLWKILENMGYRFHLSYELNCSNWGSEKYVLKVRIILKTTKENIYSEREYLKS